jgi:hypothetical protein
MDFEFYQDNYRLVLAEENDTYKKKLFAKIGYENGEKALNMFGKMLIKNILPEISPSHLGFCNIIITTCNKKSIRYTIELTLNCEYDVIITYHRFRENTDKRFCDISIRDNNIEIDNFSYEPSVPELVELVELVELDENSYGDEINQILDCFSKPENIRIINTKIYDLYDFIFSTEYILHLPLAYTFLLCNKKAKYLLNDLAKIIAHKILF